MATTQFGSMLESTSHQDHDMISDAGEIDLDVDFVINAEQIDQEVILADAPSGDQLPDEIMQENEHGLDDLVEADMQDEDYSYDNKLDEPATKLPTAELNMTGADEVNIDIEFGQHDTLIGDEVQLVDEDEITWNEPLHNFTQNTDKALNQQEQALVESTLVESSIQEGDAVPNHPRVNDEYVAPQDATANLQPSSRHGVDHSRSNDDATNLESHVQNLESTDSLPQNESEETEPLVDGPEDGGVPLDEISYEEVNEDADDEEAYIGEDNAAGETHQAEYQEGEYSNDEYNAILLYKNTRMCLFPPQSDADGLPQMSLLKNSTSADRPLPDLFRACRDALGKDINADYGLRMEVTCFGMSINEDDSDCPNVTIAQIIDVYYHLNANEEVYDPSMMEITLSIRPKISTQLKKLAEAAEAGKGLTSVHGLDFEYRNDDADNDHTTSEEDEASEEDHGAAEGFNQDDEADTNNLGSIDAPYLTAQQDDETPDTSDTQAAGVRQENLEGLNLTELKDSESTVNSASPTEYGIKDTVPNESEDDLIDYSDDEAENAEAAGSSRSSTIQDDPAAHEKNVDNGPAGDAKQTAAPEITPETIDHEEIDADFLLDFGNDDDPGVEVEGDFDPTDPSSAIEESTDNGLPKISSTHLQFELKVGHELSQELGDTVANQDDNDNLDFELDFGSGEAVQEHAEEAAPDLEVDYNDLIDFEDDDEAPNEQTHAATTALSDSPTGKRNWDQHAEGTGADEDEKELKRMKST